MLLLTPYDFCVYGRAMPDEKPKSRLAPRKLALTALQAVVDDHASLDDLARQMDGLSRLSTQELAYFHALVGTALRHVGDLEHVIEQSLERPLRKQARRTHFILVLGLAELFHMQSAAHGVVHSWVEIAANHHRSRSLKGLVNFVLRNAERNRDHHMASARPDRNIPPALQQSWRKQYGETALVAAGTALAEPPPLDITCLRNAAHWQAALGGTVLPGGTVRLSRQGRVDSLPGFGDGDWIVQDAAAAIPARLVGMGPEMTALDLCAAPGGKTLQMAANGAMVHAVEMSERRLERLRENLTRTGLHANLHLADAANWSDETRFDGVLVDAPCSASGIFRHHPDVLHTFAGRDLRALHQTQLAIAQNGARHLKPGGTMVYCVCSAQALEGEAVIQELLQSTDLILSAIDPVEAEPAAAYVQEAGWVRIPPGGGLEFGGMDGFFMARLQKPS